MAWRVRPSAIARIVRCPASLQIAGDAPAYMDEDGDNTVRDEGTACHWAAFEMSQGRAPTIGTLAPNGIAIDAPMLDASQLYLACIAQWGVAATYEQPLTVPLLPECGGTPDAFAVNWKCKTIHVADLKYGYRVVDAWPNYQLIAYGLGVASAHGIDPFDSAWCYHFTIVQPRRWHAAGAVRSVFVGAQAVYQKYAVLLPAVTTALAAGAPAIPGSHCDYCPGRARCTALQHDAGSPVVAGAHDMPFDAAERELAYMQDKLAKMEAYTSGLAAQVEHGLRNGQRSTLFEMRSNTGRLEWAPEHVGKVRALAQLMGVNIEKEPELITPTQASKLLPSEIARLYARRGAGSVQLARATPEKWASVFKNQSE